RGDEPEGEARGKRAACWLANCESSSSPESARGALSGGDLTAWAPRGARIQSRDFMMSERKPELIGDRFPVRMCPVCGKRTYSHVGVHPQCAVQQADAPR